MDKREFSQIRHGLEKTQNRLAQLLGTSHKAIQSFEQGWRNIPVHIERQMLFLLTLKAPQRNGRRPCWVIRRCSKKIRQNCPAWEFQAGHLCWFINGTICEGETQESWQKKMRVCRQCEVFRSVVPLLSGEKRPQPS